MKENTKKCCYRIAAFFAVLGAVFLLGNYRVSAATVEVTKADINSMGARNAIQKALDEARANATEADPYTVKVPSGTYTLEYVLRVYSNTTLDLTGVTLKRPKDRENQKNLIQTGDIEDESSGVTGYAYKNVHIKNGIIDGASGVGTVVKLAHAQNCSVTGTTFQNAYNAHLMEIAAVDQMMISNCTFKDQEVDPKSEPICYEAIQFDIMTSEHIAGYRSEALSVSNVTIDSCAFDNMPRGIGSHTSILNVPFTGIRITNCKFTNMQSAAIQGVDWKDCTIQNNVIQNTPKGIEIFTLREGGRCTFLPSYVAKQGKTKTTATDAYVTPTSSNLVIADNTIVLNSSKDAYADTIRAGIRVGGLNLKESKKFEDNSGNLPLGNYYLTGASITGNKITTTGYGIRIEDGRNSTISGNTIDYKDVKSDKTSYQSIWILDASKDITITSNIINKAKMNAIQVTEKSSAKEITSNTIADSGKYGINIADAGVTVDTISKNTISKSASTGIFVYNKAEAGTIRNNKISTSGKDGIGINTNGVAKNILNNTIKSSKNNAIAIGIGAKVTTISGNKVTKCKKESIKVYNKSRAKTISANKLSGGAAFGIAITSGSKVTGALTGNTIDAVTTNAIHVFDKSSVAEISSNVITGAGKYGINIANAGANVTTITKNTVTKSKQHGIFVYNKAKVTTISNNKVTSSGGNGIAVNTKASAGTIKGNKVKKSKDIGIAVGLSSKVSKITGNTIATAKTNGIKVYGKSNAKNITSNKITSPGTFGICISSASKAGTVKKNKIAKEKSKKIQIDSTSSVKKK